MRRRRSTTITADSVEEYVIKATQEVETEQKESPKPKKRAPKQTSMKKLIQLHNKDYLLSPPSDLGIIDEVEDGREFEYNFESEESLVSGSSCSFKRSPSIIGTIPYNDSSIDSISTTKALTPMTYKAMIIGAGGTGKHCLIDNLFGQTNSSKQQNKTSLDLVTRCDKQENTYKFWVKNTDNEKMESFLSVYYKNISKYIFVYDITNKGSFECLEKEIKHIQSQNNGQQTEIFLVGNFSDRELSRKVTYEQGQELREKLKIDYFTETNRFDDSFKYKLLSSFTSEQLVMEGLD